MSVVDAAELDVVCAGEALFDLATLPGEGFAEATQLSLSPGGAAVNIALALAKLGRKSALVAAIGEDALGAALVDKLARAGVETRFCTRVAERTGLVLIERGARGTRVVPYRGRESFPIVEESVKTRALVLTGVVPSTEQESAFLSSARTQRQKGARVVLDLNARRGVWAARSWGAPTFLGVIGMAHLVKCSVEDLAVMGLELEAVRASLDSHATLIVTSGAGATRAFAPFGDLSIAPAALEVMDAIGAGDAFSAGLVAEIVSAPVEELGGPDLLRRAIERGHACARELLDAKP